MSLRRLLKTLTPALSLGERVRMSRRGQAVVAGAVVLLVVGCALALWDRSSGDDILRIAYAYPDGGGVASMSSTGVPEEIRFNGIRILRASRDGTYCSGFTFAVAMRAAEERGLLEGKQPYQISRFQREWYGALPGSAEKQAVQALGTLGIGREVPPQKARAGDFIVFQRPNRTAHSAIFLEWVRYDGVIVGVKYRGSQGSTEGIADRTEYFTTSGYRYASINPERFYVGRLNAG